MKSKTNTKAKKRNRLWKKKVTLTNKNWLFLVVEGLAKRIIGLFVEYTQCVYEDCIQTALKHLKAQIFKEIKHGFTINNENDLNNKISPKDA